MDARVAAGQSGAGCRPQRRAGHRPGRGRAGRPHPPNTPPGDGSDIGAFESGSPNLSITRSPPNVVVSWPSYYGDFTLQRNTNSIASVNWSNAPGTIQDNGTIKYLIVNPPTGNRFYQLFKP